MNLTTMVIYVGTIGQVVVLGSVCIHYRKQGTDLFLEWFYMPFSL